MSQTNIAITQLAQVGLAERIVLEAQGHPEMSRQAAMQTVPDELKRQRDTVNGTEDSEGSRNVKGKKEGKGGGGEHSDGKRHAGTGKEEEEDPTQNTPWTGNILNLKV